MFTFVWTYKERRPYIVISLIAPVLQFITKYPSIELVNEHVNIPVSKTLIETFTETLSIITFDAFKEFLIK